MLCHLLLELIVVVLYQAWPRQHAHLSMIEHLGLNFICDSKWDVRSSLFFAKVFMYIC